MKIDFDNYIERFGSDCVKYDGLPVYYGKNNLLPLWIADMDFPVPEEVTEALAKRAKHPIYGYNHMPESYFTPFIRWEKKRNDWDVEEEWLCHTPGVLSALSTAILTFTKEGDEILIQPPVYFPFRSTIEALGRKVVNNQLIYENHHFTIDFNDMEEKAKTAKMFIFCSPHNPSGRVFHKDELMKVEDICRRNNLLVFSDEIHSDIIFSKHKHCVFSTLSPWAKENSIVAMSPSKTFNIAGLEMSVISIANEEKRKAYQYYLRFGLHIANPNSYGLVASQTAYEYGELWYEELIKYLKKNIDYLHEALQRDVPNVHLVYPESTYIPILDMSELGMTQAELKAFMAEEVGAALNSGDTFGPGGEGFMRINVATQRKNIVQFVENLKNAIEKRCE